MAATRTQETDLASLDLGPTFKDGKVAIPDPLFISYGAFNYIANPTLSNGLAVKVARHLCETHPSLPDIEEIYSLVIDTLVKNTVGGIIDVATSVDAVLHQSDPSSKEAQQQTADETDGKEASAPEKMLDGLRGAVVRIATGGRVDRRR
eukprot:CAMPEP_0197426092 /NCGR_PEP_ID=MMETSP1170-20131217/33713_1 /TAXON_ID=54406 /ORGANISM="Sarcinochrysis sp, Strain CCMP770" /LENGTH=148 /DNA_ID=CAMNT_0042953711 /DNA_START=17 /DNA_END=461 /DNA_ORIENTATION=+